MKRKAEFPPEAGAKVSPPGSARSRSPYPQGIEALLHEAAADRVFREQLLEQRAGAAAGIGVELDPAEKAMIESIPREQLLLTVERMEAAGERRRGFLVKLAIATLVTAAAGGVWLVRRRDPSYSGKSLSEWLSLGEQYGWSYFLRPIAIDGIMPYPYPSSASGAQPNPWVSRTPPKPEMSEVEKALHAMGAKAVPALLALLETRDPAWKLKLVNWLGKQSAVKLHFTKAEAYQKRALIGLTVLGPLATNAVPAIQKAMAETNKLGDWEFQAFAREALEKINGK